MQCGAVVHQSPTIDFVCVSFTFGQLALRYVRIEYPNYDFYVRNVRTCCDARMLTQFILSAPAELPEFHLKSRVSYEVNYCIILLSWIKRIFLETKKPSVPMSNSDLAVKYKTINPYDNKHGIKA